MAAQERRQCVGLRVAGFRPGAGRLLPVSCVAIATVGARGSRRRLGRALMDIAMDIAQRSRDRHHRNGEFRQFLDAAQMGPLLVAAECDCRPHRTGARRSTDPVHIILGNIRQLEIDDMGDVIHVDAARRDIGGDEHAAAAVAKAGKRAFALRLRFVAVDRGGVDAGRNQVADDAIGAVLGAGEDENARGSRGRAARQ